MISTLLADPSPGRYGRPARPVRPTGDRTETMPVPEHVRAACAAALAKPLPMKPPSKEKR